MRSLSAAFAQVTAAAARRAMAAPTQTRRRARRTLYASSVAAGRVLRLLLRPRGGEDAVRAFRLVYRQVGVVARFEGPRMIVDRCRYARAFDRRMCRFMCAFDCGLFAGLTGGGRLAFDARVTAGAPACTAVATHAEVRV